VNVPIGIATAVLAIRLLERDSGIGLGDGADILGALLITSSLMLGVYTIVKPAADYGWGLGQALASAACRWRCYSPSWRARRVRASPDPAADLQVAERFRAPSGPGTAGGR